MANLRLKFPVYSKKSGLGLKSRIVLKDASVQDCILQAKKEFNVDMDGSIEVSFKGFLDIQYLKITGK
jgi:hypothetical protein